MKADVRAAFHFPNHNVATFDHNGQQIPDLQGPWSLELEAKIRARSDEHTQWHGFPGATK